MENDYEKRLEEENAGLRKSIHALEDALAESRKLADSKLFSIDDMRKMIVSDYSFNIPTNTVTMQGQTFHFAGRAEVSMTLKFDGIDIAKRLKEYIDGARNVK